MSIVERPPTSVHLGSASRQMVGLRVHGGVEIDALVPLEDGKNSIGSGPRCSVRIDGAGVEPIHCLISRDGDHLRVRRWAHNSLLNGAPFDEAALEPGDRLTLGSVELDVVGPPNEHESENDYEAEYETPTVKTPRPEAVAIELESPADVVEEMSRLEHEATHEDFLGEQVSTADMSRARSRKLVTALRRNRDQFDELLDRVSCLEQRLESALHERSWTPAESDEEFAPDNIDEPTVLEENDAVESNEAAEEYIPEDAADDWLVAARAALSRDRAPWSEAVEPVEDPIDPTELDSFDAEVTELRDQLSASESRFIEAQARIAVMEQQLAEERHTNQKFADERTTWVDQLAETEVRLSEYVERIQELAGQLDEARELAVAVPAQVSATPVEIASVVAAADETAIATPLVEVAYDSEAASGGGAANYTESVATENAPTDFGWKIEEAAPSEELVETVVEESPVEAPYSPATETNHFGDGEPEQPSVQDESPAEDVDRALAHLQELSIWRQTPVAEGEMPNVDEAVKSQESSAEKPATTAPDSYIDRYAHLFDKEDDNTGSESDRPSLAAESHTTGHAAPAAVHGSGTTGAHEHHEHEEAMEEYMAKMMQRLRGSSVDESTLRQEESAAYSASQTTGTGAGNSAETADATPAEPAEPFRGRPAAELSTDMDALRALANQSARHAIGVHTARTLRRKSFTRCLIALLAAATSLFFLLQSKGWDTFPFATSCVAGLVALYFGQQTYRSVMTAIKVGAFDDVNEDFVAIDGSKMPLPIDTKR